MSDQIEEEGLSENVQRFRIHVVNPLKKRGMRKPNAFRSDEWTDELDEIGEDLGSNDDKSLASFRRLLMANATGAERRTWPNVVAIRNLANGHFGQIKEPQRVAQYEAICNRIVSFVERHGCFPPPRLNSLNDPNLLDALLALKHGGITVAAMTKAGHVLPKGYGAGR